LVHSDFKIGTDFRYRGALWRCTDVGTRVVAAICLSEVWVTKTKVNTGVKERVRLPSMSQIHFDGPPYQVGEEVIGEREMAECILQSEWDHARRILGLSGDGKKGGASR
jgi:hypothetical protein